ncbi:tail fiber assembly protein [Serratia liquefaciens]|uniref:tail fiber assembly protein n=1 Tax=Serratia liquefaciens TaxID=614 RepID=UPI0022B9D1C6|nr:tail fiber assembly protein [Serratia liquefaciens]
MTKFFSKSTNGFYSEDVNGNNIPEDSVEISDEEWQSLLDGQSGSKFITSDENGMPILKDTPPPTYEELVTLAKSKKERLIASATVVIAPLQDAMDLDMATDKEKSELLSWKKYRIELNRVNEKLSPDINWPKEPS